MSGPAPSGPTQERKGPAAPSAGRTAWKAGPVLVVLFLSLFTLYEKATVLQQMERVARDFTAQIRPPRQALDLVMVRIDATDYTELFGASSPLDPGQLARLLKAVAAGHPRAIVVDILVDSLDFDALKGLEGGIPIVWAGWITRCDDDLPEDCLAHTDGFVSRAEGRDRPGWSWGLVELTQGPDGVVRQYRRHLSVADSLRPTLAAATMTALGERPSRSDEPMFIRYQEIPVEGISVTASRLLAMAQSPDFGETGLLRDRIVLVGGTYPQARDRYPTPLGEMAGMDIHAQIIQTELEGGGLEPVGFGVIGLLLLLTSFVLVLLFHFVEDFRVAFWTSLVAIPVMATAGSWLAADSLFALWPYLVPLLVALLIQQLYSHALRYRDELFEHLGERVSARLVRAREGR